MSASAPALSPSAASVEVDAGAERALLEAAAIALGLELDGAAVDKLLAYLALLRRWNRVYNLTSVDSGQMLSLHIVDCLAIVGPLRRALAGAHGAGPEAERRVLDVGSGGGLPGVVLAIVQPDWHITCLDAVAKKASFVRQVSAELGLPRLRAVHQRAQDHRVAPGYDLIVSRAFASLEDFTGWTRHLLAPGGSWAAMKGVVPSGELLAQTPGVQVFHVEPLSPPGLDAQRCLVWLRPAAQPSASVD